MNFKEFQSTWEPYDEYRVKIHIPSIAGGIPKSKEMIAGWVGATCKAQSEEDRAKLVATTIEDLPEATEEAAEKNWCGFKSTDRISPPHIHFFLTSFLMERKWIANGDPKIMLTRNG